MALASSSFASSAIVVDDAAKLTEKQSQVLRGTASSHHHHRRRGRRLDTVVENDKLKTISSSSSSSSNTIVESLSMKTKEVKVMEDGVDSKAAKITIEDSRFVRIARLESKADKIKTIISNNDTSAFELGHINDDKIHHGGDAIDDVKVVADPEKREIFDGDTGSSSSTSSVPQKCLKPKAAKLPLATQPPMLSSTSEEKPLANITSVEDATKVSAIEKRMAIDPNTGEEDQQQQRPPQLNSTKPTPPLPPSPPPLPPKKTQSHDGNATTLEENSNTTTTTTSTPATRIDITNANATESTLISNTTTQEAVASATTTTTLEAEAEIIEYENICDMYGNLLSGETSYAPTITPADGDDEGDDQDIADLPKLADNDHDGLTNEKENTLGTDPLNSDSDTDGLDDGQEVSLGMDPLLTDTDMDGRNDYDEILSPDVLDTIGTADNDGDGLSNTVESSEGTGGFGTDPDKSDTDGDDLTDGMEVNIQGTDPIKSDTDGDALSDYDEAMNHGTNPLMKDSDGDGMSDGFEIKQGLDPLSSNANSTDEVDGISPGCEIWSMNNWDTIYSTSISASVNFMYELAVSDDSNVKYVSERMENKMARMVGGELIHCESSSTRKLSERQLFRQHHQQRRHLLVDGIDKMPEDIVTEMACTYFTPNNSVMPSNSSCYVIQGLMTLYLREDSAQTSTLQSSSEALKTILDAMNKDDPSPFLEDSGDYHAVSGVVGVSYIKGMPDEGGVVLIDNSGNPDADEEEDDVDGAVEESSNSKEAGASESLSTLGISLVAIGAAAVIGTVVAATVLLNKKKRKRGTDSKYAEFYDDGNDMDLKHESLDATTDMDASSMRDGSTPVSKRSRQMDWEGAEEDSVFSGLENMQGDYDPTFVRSPNLNDSGSVAMTTAEQGYEMAIPSMFLEERPPPRRYQASPIERPMYDNPLGIRKSPEANGRDYYVGNTVEF